MKYISHFTQPAQYLRRKNTKQIVYAKNSDICNPSSPEFLNQPAPVIPQRSRIRTRASPS